MENGFRIIYALCIIFIRFPLYYLHPLENNFVIYNSTNLCDNPIKDFLHEWKYTTNCTTMKYPKEINQLKVTETNLEMFVCLRIYDIIYKTCTLGRENEWVNIIHDKKNLDLTIQNLIRTNSNDLDMNNHCLNLSEFLPTNKELQPPLETLRESLNDTFVCKKVCFDLNKEMLPLCAVLELINEIDKEIVRHIKMNHNNLNINAVDENIRNLKGTKGSQVILENQSNVPQDESINDKKNVISVKKGTEMKKNQSVTSSVASNTPMNNANDDTSNNGDPKNPSLGENGNNHISDQQNKDVKHKLNVDQVTSQAISDSTNVYNEELYNQPHSQLDNVDKIQTININNSQESPQNTEKDDSQNKKEDKLDSEENPANPEIVSSRLQNKQTDTKSETVQSSNTPSIENAESSTHISDEQQPNLRSTSQTTNEDNPDYMSGKSDIQNVNYPDIKNVDESHFLTYFAIISFGFIAGYIGYHNKQKILAIVLEGRRSKNNRGRRRPSTANYRKLDCTLEEAVTSQCNANVTHVIY